MIVRATRDFRWIKERTSCGISDGFRAIEAVNENGRIAGMIGYDSWTENAVQMHIALDSPAALRPLLRHCFRYPFIQNARSIALGIIPAHNTRSCRLAERVGFCEVHRIVDGWDKGDDLVIYEMRKSDCRWLGGGAK